MSTALTRALSGQAVKGTAAVGALRDAVPLINRLRNSAVAMREDSKEIGRIVMHEAESTGALVASCAAEGRFGADKFKVGNVDARGPVALGLMILGVVRRKKDGMHMYAVGQGVAHSVIAGAAVRWGQRMAEKAGSTTTPSTLPAASGAPPSDAPPAEVKAAKGDDDAVDAFLREVRLQGDGDPGLARAHRI